MNAAANITPNTEDLSSTYIAKVLESPSIAKTLRLPKHHVAVLAP